MLELKDLVASTLPEFGVTMARCFTMSLENDRDNVGFFLGVSPLLSAETSRRLLSISSLILLVWWRKNVNNKKFNLNTVVTSGNYYDMCLEVNGERDDGRRNSVTLFRIPRDSDNSIVNSQITKNLTLVTMHFCFDSFLR